MPPMFICSRRLAASHPGHLEDMNRLQELSRRNISASWPGQNRSDSWIGDVHQYGMIQRIAEFHLPGRPPFATESRLGREGPRRVARFELRESTKWNRALGRVCIQP